MKSEDVTLSVNVGRRYVQERMMTEMQSDTAVVAMDTQSSDDTTQSSDAVANDISDSAAEQQPAFTFFFTRQASDVDAGSVNEVGTENTADAAADDSREHDDNVAQHLSASDTNTDSQNPVSDSSTDEAVPSVNDNDDNVSTGLPTPADESLLSSASVSIGGMSFTYFCS